MNQKDAVGSLAEEVSNHGGLLHYSSTVHETVLYILYISLLVARGGVEVKALRFEAAGRGFDSRLCHWNFSVT